VVEIIIHVKHEWFNPCNENQITPKLNYQVSSMSNTMNTCWKRCPWVFNLLCHSCPLPQKTFTPFFQKHKLFLERSSLFNPLPFNKVFMITLITLLDLNPLTILLTQTIIGHLVQPSTMETSMYYHTTFFGFFPFISFIYFFKGKSHCGSNNSTICLRSNELGKLSRDIYKHIKNN